MMGSLINHHQIQIYVEYLFVNVIYKLYFTKVMCFLAKNKKIVEKSWIEFYPFTPSSIAATTSEPLSIIIVMPSCIST